MGSVQPEIVAQAGCIYTLSNPASQGKIAYFMGIDSAEYFAPVLPGDQLCLEVDIPDNTKKFGKGHGSMIVDGKEVSRISMTFAIVDP
jgi:3-hydroxyacyl-[acyl-carrier-protein] dehydratase